MNPKALLSQLPKTRSGDPAKDIAALHVALANILRNLDDGSSGQVRFPANQNASTDANTLDDYEEGTYTPTITATAGTFTTVSAAGRYTKIGRIVDLYARITITTNGTAAGSILVPLPVAAAQAFVGCGSLANGTGHQCSVRGDAAGSANVQKYDNTYPGVNGAIVDIHLTYESA